ncbi:MAG: AAA family ATPase [Thermoplasmata archaeon]
MQPYDPQRPASPGTFAGRHELLEFAGNALRVAATLHRGSAILLYGYRGSGKTSALRKIQSIVRDTTPHGVVIEVPLRVPSTEAMLVHSIAEMVRREVTSQEKLTSRMKKALGNLSAVTVLGSGIERTKPLPFTPSTLLTVWKDALLALGDLPLLAISIDDAELLKAGEIGILKTMVETDSPVPILMVVAGGPELIEKLSLREASPILRSFSGAVFDIGQFSEVETLEALEAPVKQIKGTGRWDASAVKAIHHLTHGYPYLVQCFAAAAYQDSRRIKGEDVQRAIPGAMQLASSWLERELPEASDEDIRAFAKIATSGKVEFRSSDAIRMGINHIYLSRLTTQGVLKRLARGHYELRMAPAIAYFHALRRGLSAV